MAVRSIRLTFWSRILSFGTLSRELLNTWLLYRIGASATNSLPKLSEHPETILPSPGLLGIKSAELHNHKLHSSTVPLLHSCTYEVSKLKTSKPSGGTRFDCVTRLSEQGPLDISTLNRTHASAKYRQTEVRKTEFSISFVMDERVGTLVTSFTNTHEKSTPIIRKTIEELQDKTYQKTSKALTFGCFS